MQGLADGCAGDAFAVTLLAARLLLAWPGLWDGCSEDKSAHLQSLCAVDGEWKVLMSGEPSEGYFFEMVGALLD